MNTRTKTTTLIVFLTSLSLLGLVIVQLFLLKRAANLESRLFEQTVHNALHRIVNQLETAEAAHALRSFLWYNKEPVIREEKIITHHTGSQDSIRSVDVEVRVNMDSIPRVRRVNDKLMILLKKPEHVIVKTMDSSGQVVTAVMDEHKPAGRYEVKIPGRDQVRVHMLSDTSSFVVQMVKDKKDSMVLSGNFVKEKRILVNRVIDELVLVQDKSVLMRINPMTLDSIITITLKESGLPPKYYYGIVALAGDSLLLSKPPGFSDQIKSSPFRTLLFPNDIRLSKSELCLFFPTLHLNRDRRLLPFLFLSGLFLLLLIVCFVYIIRTLAGQKTFSLRLVDFINNMTHEFKTPITTISLAGETMTAAVDKMDAAKLTQYSRIIIDESRRMRGQVEKILQMAALEQGEFELHLEPVDVHSIIEQVFKNFSLQVEKCGGVLLYQPQAIVTLVNGDMVHLQNILHNLLDNAVKYTRQQPRIVIQTRNRNEGIEISIQDNGIGLAAQEQVHIFEKFYRVNTGNVHDVKGFGIGLSYVKLMVEAHRGKISVVSTPGQGSCFTLWLPLLRKQP